MKQRVILVINLLIVLECTGNTGRPHHHHHHRHQHTNRTVGFEELGEISAEIVSTIERRVESLEEDVKYLCIEDEEDVDRRIRHLGVKCVCPTIEAPVCGSDDVTYRNRCFLQCHAKHALLNYNRHRITLKYFGSCGHEL